ncbi:MAG: hypothetical protein AB9856_03620 [Cellulosilyticaceae bacterium]
MFSSVMSLIVLLIYCIGFYVTYLVIVALLKTIKALDIYIKKNTV